MHRGEPHLTSAIVGLGHYLPPQVERAGVRRPIAVDPVGPSTLAASAAQDALARAALSPEEIDFIVFATMTPDVTFPGSGCYLQAHLGCNTVGALDVRAQCAGFVFGLSIADQFIRAGIYGRIALVGAEVHSSGLDYTGEGAGVARLYGDGAGVAILGTSRSGAGLRAATIHSDGRQHRKFWCEYPSSRQHPLRMTVENLREGLHFPKIELDEVRRFGEASLVSVVDEALRAAGLQMSRVDYLVLGHLLPEVAEDAGRRLGVPAARLDIPAVRHGHLTAAALPVALSEAVTRGAVGPGMTVCLAASGAGYCWGAAVLTL